MTGDVEVTAYCLPTDDLRLSGYGWSGSPRYLQSVSVTAGDIEVMTVYRDTDFTARMRRKLAPDVSC